MLVVEDEPDIRNLVVLHLTREGYRCRTAVISRSNAFCGSSRPAATTTFSTSGGGCWAAGQDSGLGIATTSVVLLPSMAR